MRRLPPHVAAAGSSPARYVPLSPAPAMDQGQRLTDIQAIQRLFANGENGGYWPADPAYCYQYFQFGFDGAKSLENDVVGMRLDISKGLAIGNNVLTNGGFDSDSVWVKGTGWSIADGVASRLTPGTSSVVTQNNVLTVGQVYWVTGDYNLISANGFFYSNNNGQNFTTLGIGKINAFVLADAHYLRFGGNATHSGTYDNVSAQLVAGNHAIQATTANKPYLRRTPVSGKYWLDSNTATGALTATFSGSLGSACTIASVSAEGVTIAENQTVGTTYNLCPAYGYNGDILIIDRALTVAEKALVTRVLSRNVPTLGPNLAINQAFDNSNNITLAGNWTVSNGVLVHTAGGGQQNARLLLSKTLSTATIYYSKITLVTRTAGNLLIGIGGFSYHTIGSVPGAYTVMRVASATAAYFYVNNNSGNFDGSVDNVAVLEVF